MSVGIKTCPCLICYECVQFQIEIRKISLCGSRSPDNAEFAISKSPIIHLVCSPKFCITFVSHISWVLQSSQGNLKTTLMQNFGGQTRCIMRDVEMANLVISHWGPYAYKTATTRTTPSKNFLFYFEISHLFGTFQCVCRY